MEKYFKIDGIDINYPVHLVTNGVTWNFRSEYDKRRNICKSVSLRDTPHLIMDLMIDVGLFSYRGIKVVKEVPLIITDDVRAPGEKKRYYIVDYMIPDYNMIVLLTNSFKKSLGKKSAELMRKTLSNMGYDVVEMSLNYDDMDKISNIIRGFLSSFSYRTRPEVRVIPDYSKLG